MVEMISHGTSFSRALALLLVTVYFLLCVSSPAEYHFIDAVNLIFHEAGHTLLMFFGTFLHILGGSLLQVLIPVVLAGYFFLRQEYFSMGILLLWVGQSMVNVSVYAGDAVRMALPLLGGDSAIHDWHAMLDMLSLLEYTRVIALVIYLTGCIIGVLGVIIAVRSLSETPRLS